jgi:hypothetical protein
MADPDPLAEAARLEREGLYEDLARHLGKLRNLTAHEDGPLPCLCKRCLDPARVSVEDGGAKYRRGYSIAEGRVLYYWMPEEIAEEALAIAKGVRANMKKRIKDSSSRRKVIRW